MSYFENKMLAYRVQKTLYDQKMAPILTAGKRMQEAGSKMQREGLRLTLSVIVLIVFVLIVISLI
jgi:hypothetical protein